MEGRKKCVLIDFEADHRLYLYVRKFPAYFHLRLMPINIQTQLHIFHDDFSTLVFFFFSKIVSYIDSFTMNAVWL